MSKLIRVRLLSAKTLRILTAAILVVLAGRLGSASDQTLTNIYIFGVTTNDGRTPYAGLIQANDGNFYGTTSVGGANNRGTVFRISSNGSLTNLYSFTGGSDGGNPYAGLVQGSDGNFYGTTYFGGTNGGNGTVFRISPSGSFTNLHMFSDSEGGYLHAGLVQGSDGNFYGTAALAGGPSTNCSSGCGTVFRISPSGNFIVLHHFSGSDGAEPYAGLVQGSDGNFYGTTYYGGAACVCGTIFRTSQSGSFTNLHTFNGSDGQYPHGSLVQGIDGNTYGTTEGGGTVFRISPSGDFTNLYTFSGPDGSYPYAGLVQGSDGNFYGTTQFGGTASGQGFGTAFRITSNGSLTSLFSFFINLIGGRNPTGGLVQDNNGNFYGTTSSGGTGGNGTVFRLTVPLSPPANQISALQLVGSNGVFSIPSVAGETYQLQCSYDLTSGNWSNIPGVWVSNCIGGLLTLTNLVDTSQPQGFYRFAITP